MARKKYLDENNEDEERGQQHQKSKGQGGVKSFQQQNLGGGILGGGTKNRNKSHDYRHSKNSDDSYVNVTKQLSSLGLTIREMPGDGNCLFRALSDQIGGSSRNHLESRRSVVQYMKDFRADFEPFVEDDVPFDKYVQRLSQAGTFAGNDAIVAFARLHNVSVVIHQLNSPAWVIHPSKETHGHPTGREVHIFYHNGDHYNSVRRLGDDSENPTNIRLHAQTNSSAKAGFNKPSGKKSPPHTTSSIGTKSSTSATDSYNSVDYDSYSGGRDEDYWVKDTSDVDRLVEEVIQNTNYPDPNFVRETLLDYNFDMVATINFILSITVMMNQHQSPPGDTEQEIAIDEGNQAPVSNQTQDLNVCESEFEPGSKSVVLSPSKKLVTDMDEQLEKVVESEDSGIPEESDESSSSPSEVCSSQDNEGTPTLHKEPRLNGRQKKEKKKRERKREADLRRKRSAGNVGGTESEKEVPENTVVISNLGTLDI